MMKMDLNLYSLNLELKFFKIFYTLVGFKRGLSNDRVVERRHGKIVEQILSAKVPQEVYSWVLKPERGD